MEKRLSQAGIWTRLTQRIQILHFLNNTSYRFKQKSKSTQSVVVTHLLQNPPSCSSTFFVDLPYTHI
jgi:hypothetical protein